MRMFFVAIIFACAVHAQTVRVDPYNKSVQKKAHNTVSPTRKKIDAELAEITKNKKIPTVWLTPERATELNRVTSRSYITKIERKGGDVIYTWTNGLHGAVTTQRVDKITNRPARDARREEFDKIKTAAEKMRKERDDLRNENETLKKGSPKK